MDIYEIISKYLTGESSEAENNELANWRKLNGENEKVFQELRESWELANGDAPSPYYPDKEKVWNRITTNIKQVKMTKTYTHRLFTFCSNAFSRVGISSSALLIRYPMACILSANFTKSTGNWWNI